MKPLRLGAGAGFSGDRIDPAVDLVARGDLDVLVFECLAERTIALAQQARRRDPDLGYDPHLGARMAAVLPLCREKGVRVVTNMGAANPLAAARKVRDVARDLGLHGLRIAAVTGDDVLEGVRDGDFRVMETGEPVSAYRNRLVSANAYLGAAPIVEALAGGAEVVITGRAADPALFLAPLIHHFGWRFDDWDRLGAGTVVGHLLECAGQITGGYFADPGVKDVAGLARLGLPIGIVSEDGSLEVTKTPESGGLVSPATCKEQLLYEIHDPARYFQPDVLADFSAVSVHDIGPDRVRVAGGKGAPRSGLLKVSLGYVDSYVGEGQVTYAGPGAVARGRLALEIVAERLRLTGVRCRETRQDLIGLTSVLGEGGGAGAAAGAGAAEPFEVRARFAASTDTMADAERIAHEVDALYINGPAGGGGISKSAREVIGVVSILIPEDLVTPVVHRLEA